MQFILHNRFYLNFEMLLLSKYCNMRHCFYYILLSLILFSLPSCRKKEVNERWNDTLRSGIIKIASDENFEPMIEAQVNSFEAHHDYQAIIVPVYGNEKEVIRLLIEDSVRLAIVSRNLNVAEKAELESRNAYIKTFLIAFDGIALVTNTMNQDSLMSISTIRKILTGEITEWSQINPKTALGAVRVLFDNGNSGILRYAVDSITGKGDISGNLYALNSPLEVLKKVIEMPNAIGLVGVSFLSDEVGSALRELKNNVRMLRISREEKPTLANSYLPYAGDIRLENYPFWRPVYALLADPRSGLSSGFTIFLSQEVGQKIMLHSGLFPILNSNVTDVRIIDVPLGEKYRSRTIN
jgi:ABC-type phosphate transport system, periplasmic component